MIIEARPSPPYSRRATEKITDCSKGCGKIAFLPSETGIGSFFLGRRLIDIAPLSFEKKEMIREAKAHLSLPPCPEKLHQALGEE
jgi:hypothetical protein